MFSIRLLIVLPLATTVAVAMAMAQAPDIVWMQYFGESRSDVGIFIRQTSDEGYIIAGKYHPSGETFPDLYYLKTNEFGDSLWATQYGEDGYNDAVFIFPTVDNCYLAGGNFRVSGEAESYINLAKLNSAGGIIWAYTYGDTGIDLANDAVMTSDGGLIVTGLTNPPGIDNYDVYLLRVNSDGDTLWTRTYGFEYFDLGWSVADIESGGFMVLANIRYSLFVNGLTLMRIDDNGDSLWSRIYGEYAGTGVSVIPLDNGDFAILSNTLFYDGEYHGEYAIHLMRVNAIGDTLWTSCIRGIDETMGKSVQQTVDGGFIICGSVGPYWDNDQYIIKTNYRGDTLWTKTVQGTDYGGDMAYSIIQANDSGYVYTGAISTADNSGQIHIVKLAAEQVGIDGDHNHLLPVRAKLNQNYPNPFNAITKITFEIAGQEFVTIKIYDLLGREIKSCLSSQLNAGTHAVLFDASDLPSGMYFYKLYISGHSECRPMILLK